VTLAKGTEERAANSSRDKKKGIWLLWDGWLRNDVNPILEGQGKVGRRRGPGPVIPGGTAHAKNQVDTHEVSNWGLLFCENLLPNAALALRKTIKARKDRYETKTGEV